MPVKQEVFPPSTPPLTDDSAPAILRVVNKDIKNKDKNIVTEVIGNPDIQSFDSLVTEVQKNEAEQNELKKETEAHVKVVANAAGKQYVLRAQGDASHQHFIEQLGDNARDGVVAVQTPPLPTLMAYARANPEQCKGRIEGEGNDRVAVVEMDFQLLKLNLYLPLVVDQKVKNVFVVNGKEIVQDKF